MGTVVLGAGIAGLAYAYHSGGRCEIYEKEGHAGGLCASFQIGRFTFDSAVHLSFTNSAAVRKVFDQTEYLAHRPLAYNFYEGKYVKHPMIYNLNKFSTEDKCRYIESFLGRETDAGIGNYGDWLAASYGREMAEDFYGKYTRKYWTVTPDKMSTAWIGGRLQDPDLHKILSGSYADQSEENYYAEEMRYPQRGGYCAFLNPLLDLAQGIHYKKEAVGIDAKNREVLFSDGSGVRYSRLVSSLPLNRMPGLVKGTPADVAEAAERLAYSKVSIVSIGFRRPDAAKHLWMYVYDEDILAARINSPSIKSPANAPDGCSSLQFEIYHGAGDAISEERILENTRYAIRKMGIAEEGDILFMDYRLLPYGNVIFYNGMEKDRETVRDYMRKCGIRMIGRFGEWDYLWSDQSYLSGMRAAEKESDPDGIK